MEARRQIGDIPAGEARLTPAFGLNAKYVIHTVGPVWKGGMADEAEQLRNCYLNSLNLAVEHHCESIAVPLISTGNYGFPKDLALQTAMSAISSFLLEHEMQVFLVVFDKNAYSLSEKLFKAVESYIDDHYVEEVHAKEYLSEEINRSRDRELVEYSCSMALPQEVLQKKAKALPNFLKPKRKLEDLLKEVEDTFSESLMRWN